MLVLWLRVELNEFQKIKGTFLLELSAVLRTVVTIKSIEKIEDVLTVKRKRRSLLRFKRDSESGSGYV